VVEGSFLPAVALATALLATLVTTTLTAVAIKQRTVIWKVF
jgi:uncharacterized MnhB-related membrane protein